MAIVKSGMVLGTAVLLGVLGGCDQPAASVTAAPAETPTATAAPSLPAPIVGNFNSPDAWQSMGGAPAPEGLAEGAYTFGPLGGTMSRESLPAAPGDKFAVDYSVKLVSPPTNGKPANFVVGPMFLDSQGNVLAWGNVEQPLVDPSRDAHVETEAPAGTARVHLYIGGMWAADPPAPDGKIAYTAAKLNALPK